MAKVSLSDKIDQLAAVNPAAAELLDNLSQFESGSDIQFALDNYDECEPLDEEVAAES